MFKTTARALFVTFGTVYLVATLPTPAKSHFKGNASAYDYPAAVRDLCYRLDEDVKADPLWVSWIDNAINNWNKVSDKTGWKFHPCDQSVKRPNVRFTFGKSEAGAQGNFRQTGSEDYQIIIQKDIIGSTINGKKIEGPNGGWRLEGDTTLDPILVVMHELTHAMRLDHDDGSPCNTPNLENPVCPGVHKLPTGRMPSADDIKQAKGAAEGREVGMLPASAPYHALNSGAYLGGELAKNSGRVRSIETLAATGEITNQFSDSGDPLGIGFVVGYNMRWNGWTFGPFFSVDRLHQTINRTFPGGSYLGTSTHWVMTFGGKAGYYFAPEWLAYGLVAASLLNQDLNINFAPVLASKNVTTPGFTSGFGLEYQPTGWSVFGYPISLFAQYQHTWYQTATFAQPASSPFFNYAFKRDDDTVKFGFSVYLQAQQTPPPKDLITK